MNFAEPISAADALDHAAGELTDKAQRLRREASVLLSRADELDDAWADLKGMAARFRQHQPSTEAAS